LREARRFKKRSELNFSLTLKTWKRNIIRILNERRKNMKISLLMKNLSMRKRKIEISNEERNLNNLCKMKKTNLRSK